MSISDLTATFTDHFNELRQPGADVVCVGHRKYHNAAKAHASKNGYTFATTESPKAFQFERTLIGTHLSSITAPALEAAATAAGVHVLFHVSPTTLSGEGYVRHSIIYRPGPDGWISALYKSIAEGKVITAAPTALNHGSYCATTITYPGIYANEVALMRSRCEDYPDGDAVGRRYLTDRLWWLDAARFNSQWLLDYRTRCNTDVEFNFGYNNFDHGGMECEECTAVLRDDVITYQCHCAKETLSYIDTEVAELKARLTAV